MFTSVPSPTELPKLELFGYTDLMLVKDMAAGMSKEEILEAFSLDKKDLEADKDSQIAFDEFYAFGRGMAQHEVIKNLIEASKGKVGTQAALQYLRRFSKEFEGEVEGDASGTFSFSFGEKQV